MANLNCRGLLARPVILVLRVLEKHPRISELRCLCTFSAVNSSSHFQHSKLIPRPSYKPQPPIRCLFKLPNFSTGSLSSKRKKYSERRILGYTMEQMYDVVSDVGSYKDFIPWCINSNVFEVMPTGCKSRMEIGFPPLVEKYNCTIKLIRPTLVHSECTEGKLFTQLLTVWRFSPGLPENPKTCTLDFSVMFEFRSQLHSQLAAVFFDEIVKTMVNAFLKRARTIYGQESIKSQKPKVTAYSS